MERKVPVPHSLVFSVQYKLKFEDFRSMDGVCGTCVSFKLL